MLPATSDRVVESTEPSVNRRLREEAEERVQFYARHPEGIASRLDELDREWDIERALEANAASFAFVGVALGSTVNKRWLILPALVTGFLFQHAIQGWCPPLPVLRRLGFRTASEIERERNALKALRGDYRNVSLNGHGSERERARAAIDAASS